MSNYKILRGSTPLTQAEQDSIVVVDDRFSILVPQGMMFSSDRDELPDKAFILFSTDGEGEMSDPYDIEFYSSARVRLCINSGFKPFNGTADFSNEQLRQAIAKTCIDNLSGILGALSKMTGVKSLPPFVVKNDEEAVVVAATNGVMGNAGFMLAVPSGLYTGMYRVSGVESPGKASSKPASPAEFKAAAEELLGSIGGPQPKQEPACPAAPEPGQAEPQESAEEAADDGGQPVAAGAFIAPVPPGMACAVSGSGMPEDLSGRFELICIPAGHASGFAGYESAPVSITVGKPKWNAPVGVILERNIDGASQFTAALIAEAAGAKPPADLLKAAKQEPGFLTCFCPCADEGGEGWSSDSFAFLIAAGEFYYTGNYRFGQGAGRENEVEGWLRSLSFAGDKAAEQVLLPIAREHLGPYCGANGKVDALTVAELFADDVIFFPEKPFDRTPAGLNLSPQFNLAKQDEHPFIRDHMNELMYSMLCLFFRLDNCEELSVPGGRLHPELLVPLLDDRLTGLSFLNLMAYHLVKIVRCKDDGSRFSVYLDRNVAAGMPDAFRYTCNFIRIARGYNGIEGPFTVEFAAAAYLGGPISEPLDPVAGSAEELLSDGLLRFTVSGSGEILREAVPDVEPSAACAAERAAKEEEFKARRDAREAREAEDAKARAMAKEICEKFESARLRTIMMMSRKPGHGMKESLVQSFGKETVDTLKTSLMSYASVKAAVSADAALEIVKALQRILDSVDGLFIDVTGKDAQTAPSFLYKPSFDISRLVVMLDTEAAALKERAGKERDELSRQEQEEAACAQAWKLGMSSAELLERQNS